VKRARAFFLGSDHKSVGLRYLTLAVLALMVGMSLSLVMRWQLADPAHDFGWLERVLPAAAPAGAMAPEFYLALVTMHGTIMVFFVLTTAPIGGLGNYMLPLQLGAARTALPWLGALSSWLSVAAFAILVGAFFVEGGAPTAGWTAYPPLSALGARAGPGQGGGMDLWIASIAVFCVGAALNALNLLATVLVCRAPGMSFGRMPLPCWGWFTSAAITLLAFPVLVGAAALLWLDRHAGTGFFVPGGLFIAGEVLPQGGGTPLLWQHLFWFFGHPEVYIVILPVMGIVSEVLAVFGRKPVFGYTGMVSALLAIGGLGFLVWGHHMFVSGLNPLSAMTFSFATLVIGVPSALKVVNWLGTLWRARLQLRTATLWALGFVSLFITGGAGGIFLAQTSVDLYLHDTYFVVAHFHIIMGTSVLFGLLAGVYYWFPRMTGRLLDEKIGKLHFVATFVGVHLIFVPMHVLGWMGHPRRYADASMFRYLDASLDLQGWITWAALGTGAAQLLFCANVVWCMFKGARATVNPWSATSLEWNTDPVPRVHRRAYDFTAATGALDFRPQWEALAAPIGQHPEELHVSPTTLVEPPVVPRRIDLPPQRKPPTGGGGSGGDDWAEPERPAGPHIAVFGIWIALASIFMLFMAFVSAYVVRQGLGNGWRGVPVPSLLWATTAILLASSLVLERGRRVLRQNGAARGWLVTTLGLGIVFVIGQVMAWRQLSVQGNGMGTTPFTSFFYLLTGAHALHLAGGIVGLAIAAAWPTKRWPRTPPEVVTRVAAIYWHFMGILWLGLFALLRYWQ
jgi:cytochrome c oxidase subunit 1